MGTSISQPSPDNTNWKPVKIGYKSKEVPVRRVIEEIWRASENQEKPLSTEINSDIIFKCHQLVAKSDNANDAIKNFTKEIIKTKKNSIVAEFAKRAIPSAYLSENVTKQWRSAFFSELTDYIVSRDTSGYVGDDYRNQSISDLNSFKSEIRSSTNKIIDSIKIEPKTLSQWHTFVEKAIGNSKSYRK